MIPKIQRQKQRQRQIKKQNVERYNGCKCNCPQTAGGILLKFDFERFRNIALSIYPTDAAFTCHQALAVFYCYFQYYEHYMHQPHPPIRVEQIVNIIMKMDRAPDRYTGELEIFPECYPAMIAKHFRTNYGECDYNINHFFAGQIRGLRYYETCY